MRGYIFILYFSSSQYKPAFNCKVYFQCTECFGHEEYYELKKYSIYSVTTAETGGRYKANPPFKSSDYFFKLLLLG